MEDERNTHCQQGGEADQVEVMDSESLSNEKKEEEDKKQKEKAPASGDTAVSNKLMKNFRDQLDSSMKQLESKLIQEVRGSLMVLATLAVSIAYQAGLNPPGGFWQDDGRGHTAGTPVLRDKYRARYLTFYYFNATALVMSLVIILLLMNKKASVKVLAVATIVDFMSLVAAYVAGSTVDLLSSIGIIVVTSFFFLYFARWILLYVVGGLFIFIINFLTCGCGPMIIMAIWGKKAGSETARPNYRNKLKAMKAVSEKPQGPLRIPYDLTTVGDRTAPRAVPVQGLSLEKCSGRPVV